MLDTAVDASLILAPSCVLDSWLPALDRIVASAYHAHNLLAST